MCPRGAGRTSRGGENPAQALVSGKQVGASPHKVEEKQERLLCHRVLGGQKKKQETQC